MVTAPLTATVVSILYGVTHLGFISGFITSLHLVSGDLAAVAVPCALLVRDRQHLPIGRLLSLEH